jgi:DNA-binding transcriptional LysR family regulator
MYDWIEFRQVRYLLTILEKQGFRDAAEELHISRRKLAAQARRFQDKASVRLFRKMNNGRIQPTEAGIAFIVFARQMLEARDQAINELIAVACGAIDAVRFGCAPSVDQGLFRSFCDLHKTILPQCSVRPIHGDPARLLEDVTTGAVDAAIVTLPLKHPDLRIEELRRDRLVVCLRRDHALAGKAYLQPVHFKDNLPVLYDPQQNPDAHERILEPLADARIKIEEYSRVSHPSEMQMLVKEGYGFALIREGTHLDDNLTTRPITGVSRAVKTAVIYHKQRHPKIIPFLVKTFRNEFNKDGRETGLEQAPVSMQTSKTKRIPLKR